MTTGTPVALQTSALLGIAALCIALNVGLGTIVNVIKLPVYLDAVGTIAIALLSGSLGGRGFVLSAIVGAASFLLTGVLFNPVVMWFIPTQIAIAAFALYVIRPSLQSYILDERLTLPRTALIAVLGIALGVVAGVVSAPIIVYVFGGITGSGTSLIVAILLKAGTSLYESVLATGLASESLDKTLQLALALGLVLSTPRRLRAPSR